MLLSKKIYISPSNQSANTYATGNTNEKEQCHKIAKYCVAYLKKAGFNTKCTYNDDMYVNKKAPRRIKTQVLIPITLEQCCLSYPINEPHNMITPIPIIKFTILVLNSTRSLIFLHRDLEI